MDTENEIYRNLQRHLDNSPVSFPATKSGAEIRLLKRFFTPEEAKVAMQISTFKPESLKHIYQHAKKSGMPMSIEELQKILDQMVYKGTLLACYQGYKEKHYKNAGFTAGGIIDLQVDRMTKEMVEDFHAYMSEQFARVEAGADIGISQLRTIPVERSIPLPEKFKVGTYDSVRQLIENAPGPLAIATCPCRQTKDFSGQHCTKSDLREWCMQIGSDHARQYIDSGIGRQISKEEAFEILDNAMELGFVLDPGNSQEPKEICICCGDCCGFLGAMKKSPRPADRFQSNYYAVVDPELCKGCGLCVTRCQMDARTIVNGKAVIDLDRCIGCGNCVANCKAKASQLQKKEKELVPPKTRNALTMQIMAKRKGRWSVLKVKTKMLLGLRV
jgi:electron transport complex protein RnfB